MRLLSSVVRSFGLLHSTSARAAFASNPPLINNKMATKFEITYSCNWDGGQQEFQTAADCVKRVFPDASIHPNKVDVYPIKVTVNAKTESSIVQIWSGRQQSLFRKNRANRDKSMQEMNAQLIDFKESLE